MYPRPIRHITYVFEGRADMCFLRVVFTVCKAHTHTHTRVMHMLPEELHISKL
jgi:hypothetical protein